MRLSKYIVLATLAVLLFSCSRQKDRMEEAAPSVEEVDQDIIAAVRFAYSLEEKLWEQEDKIDEKEDVVTLFRKGFSEELARDYADYVWIEERGKNGTRYRMLRAGDPVLILPEVMKVVNAEGDKAIVHLQYKESTEGPVTWEAHTDIVTLRREQDGWKIYNIKTRED